MSFDPKTGGPRAFTDIRLGALEQIGEVLRNHYPEKPKVTEKHSSPDSALRAALQQIADTDQYPDHEDTAAELREIARRGLESVPAQAGQWPIKIDEMLGAMSRAAHLASDSNADLLPSYRRELDLIQSIRSELLIALARAPAQGAQVTDAEARRLEAIDRADGLKRPAQPQAAPAQDDPLLPCDVALPNNTFIRKGCKLSTLFHALECRGLKFAPSVTAAAPQAVETTDSMTEAAKPSDNAWLKAKIRLSICTERGMTPWEAFEDAATFLLGLIRHNNDSDDPPMKWLIERLRGLATDLVADQLTPWIGERDPKQHICWTAADRLAALSRPERG
jgi:hypothetical protein